MTRLLLRGCSPVLLLAALSALLQCAALGAAPLTTDSPEVKAAVEKATAYLSKKETWDDRMGGQALMGLALVKHGARDNHPKIAQVVASLRNYLRGDLRRLGGETIYSSGLSLIFFCELDPERYRSEVQRLLSYLLDVQKPHGGWGYLDKPTGDTSMTQYGALGMWEAVNAGFTVPATAIERLTMWLMRTQDPSGAYGYQGNVSPTYEPIPQGERVGIELATMAAGSLYICGDLARLYGKERSETEGIPEEFTRVQREGSVRGTIDIDQAQYKKTQERVNAFFEKNFTIDTRRWLHYYLYATERYCSFREMAEEREGTRHGWYDKAAQMLMQTQRADGSWHVAQDPTLSVAAMGPPVDTAFAALFLMRSMKKSIERARLKEYGAGMLVGGRGLPGTNDELRVMTGKVVAVPELAEVDQLLSTMDDSIDEAEMDRIEGLATAPAENADMVVNKHALRLRQLAGSDSPDARLAAVLTLGRSENLDNVPTLIHSLSDSDPEVMIAAREALKRISRRFEGFGPPNNATDRQRKESIEAWKQWYLAIRPDARFEEAVEVVP